MKKNDQLKKVHFKPNKFNLFEIVVNVLSNKHDILDSQVKKKMTAIFLFYENCHKIY